MVRVMTKHFDLNIEKILDNWEVHHAIREIIANALDEQLLTGSTSVDIYKDGEAWIIRDYGRGLQYTHLTQNENDEKKYNDAVIGKFGIGLKDALATFDRHGVLVTAKSKHNIVSIIRSPKQEFKEIITLHAAIEELSGVDFAGTEFVLHNVTDCDIDKAKKLFLCFSGEDVIESSRYGQIVRRAGKIGNIYINGVKVAEENNFMFSYNITAMNAAIKKALNRERTNVGRTAYTEAVKKILLHSTGQEAASALADDLTNLSAGTAHEELAWLDVQEHAVKILNQKESNLFITASEAMQNVDMVDEAKNSKHNIIIIPDSLKHKIQDNKDLDGNPIADLKQFVGKYNSSFEYDFIAPDVFSRHEKTIYDMTPRIITLFGGQPDVVKEIRISTTMRKDVFCDVATMGCWDSTTGTIVILRGALKSLEIYAGTLIHELMHAKTGHKDATREFEASLTEHIGSTYVHLLEATQSDSKSKPWYRFW